MSTTDANYRSLQAELTQILAQLDNPDLDIDQAIKHYERGMVIVRQLDKYLTTAQNKINKVKASFQ